MKVRMIVKALSLGYYHEKRQREGVQFVLKDKKDFSHRWMKPIGWTPDGYVEPEAPEDEDDGDEAVEQDDEPSTMAEAQVLTTRAQRRAAAKAAKESKSGATGNQDVI